MKEYKISLDELFDGPELWDALNTGSYQGHYISELIGTTKELAVKKAIERITPELEKLFLKYIEEDDPE
jgi:hypothetical protein